MPEFFLIYGFRAKFVRTQLSLTTRGIPKRKFNPYLSSWSTIFVALLHMKHSLRSMRARNFIKVEFYYLVGSLSFTESIT